MNFKRLMPESTALRAGSALVLVALLAACSGSGKPKPAELPANPPRSACARPGA
jgi:outer membrane protein assembly factor BamB